MPRTKKAAGTAVDRRNGRQAELAPVASVARFDLPDRAGGWRGETMQAWAKFWADPVAAALTEVDEVVLLRWADHLNRAAELVALADLDPVAKGSMGQPVENPRYGIAARAMAVVEKCEAQLGIGALNRARLGIAIISEKAALEDVNRRYLQPPQLEEDEDDPRD
jgi:hypothetical protein